MAKLFNIGNVWGNLRPKAQKLEIEVFFRGMGGVQDCVLALAKLTKQHMSPAQAVIVDGIEFAGEPGLKRYGEASLGLTFFSMDSDKDLGLIKTVLYNFDEDPDYSKDSWINDYDQYGKIQIRSRVDDSAWSTWTYYDIELQAETA